MRKGRWKRFDKKSGLWQPTSKWVYQCWYKYLQHAERDTDRTVDWSKYDGWGDAETILNTEFRDWWEKHWKDLFGFIKNETEPRFPLATTRPQVDGIKYSLVVYELHKNNPEMDYWELAKVVAQSESPRRRYKGSIDPNYKPDAWTFNNARPAIRRKLEKEDKKDFKEKQRNMRSRVGRYLIVANRHLDNVCQGKFP